MGHKLISLNYVADLLDDTRTRLNMTGRVFLLELGAQDIHGGTANPPAADWFLRRGYWYLCLDAQDEADKRNNDHCSGWDLNEPYATDREYAVVTNFGTSEHVFNQLAVFETMHDACTEGGYMVHGVPRSMVDHGLFNYTAKFFEALAEANDYSIEWPGTRLDESAYDGGPMLAVTLAKNNRNDFRRPYDYSNR
jgi:hypothetical protein